MAKIDIGEVGEDKLVIIFDREDLDNITIAFIRAVNTWQDPPENIRDLKNELVAMNHAVFKYPT